jgi:hypothetical protein
LKTKWLHGAGKNIHDSTKGPSHETEFNYFDPKWIVRDLNRDLC